MKNKNWRRFCFHHNRKLERSSVDFQREKLQIKTQENLSFFKPKSFRIPVHHNFKPRATTVKISRKGVSKLYYNENS